MCLPADALCRTAVRDAAVSVPCMLSYCDVVRCCTRQVGNIMSLCMAFPTSDPTQTVGYCTNTITVRRKGLQGYCTCWSSVVSLRVREQAAHVRTYSQHIGTRLCGPHRHMLARAACASLFLDSSSVT